MYRMMPRVHQDDFSRRKDDPVEHQDENAPRMICMSDQDDFPKIILAKVCNTAIVVDRWFMQVHLVGSRIIM